MMTNRPATARRRIYRARRASGVCTQCGAVPAEQGRPMCEACRLTTNEASRRRQRKMRVLAVVLGTCIQCLQRERIRGLKWCAVCAENHTERQRARREKNRQEGKCARCGGIYPCEPCRAIYRKRNQEYRARQKAKGIRRAA